MKQVKVYTAMSLDGFVADKAGKIDWLLGFPNPEGTDYGYADFFATIDTTLIGHTTYKDILAMGDFPYTEKTNYVFTRDRSLTSAPYVTFVSENIIDFVRELKAGTGKDIWLAGGGQLNGALLAENLIDEMILHVIPIVLGDGIPAFGGIPMEKVFQFTEAKPYSSGVLELHYKK